VTDDPGPTEVEVVISHCRGANGRLFDTLDQLGDDVGGPSLLPGWTVGHVLTHLARNADSHVWVLEAARHGRAVEQYPGGGTQRAKDIDAGATRAADTIIEDVRRSTRDLDDAWAAMTAADWEGHGLSDGRPWSCAAMPASRWREIEVHHVDLGRRYTAADWPDEFVARELPLALAALSHRLTDPGSRRHLLSWILCRGGQPPAMALDPLPASGDLYGAAHD
jgi:maleylpyruvate isomerase